MHAVDDPEFTQGPINNKAYKVVAATNHLKAPSDSDNDDAGNQIRYDAAGNQIKDVYTQTQATGNRTYDAENRMLTADGTTGQPNRYTYSAEGKRTRRIIKEGTPQQQIWWMIYGLGGELVAEYPAQTAASTPSKEYGYRNGELLIVGGCDVARWLVSDHLGTPKIEVEVSGGFSGLRRHDYLPFGEELGAGVGGRTTTNGYSADCVRQQFGSKERDNETGLDYFGARYYGAIIGRFSSSDTPFADQEEEDPQSWNLYSYVRNNPLRLIDPNGESVSDPQKQDNCLDNGACLNPTTGIYEIPGEDGRPFINVTIRPDLNNEIFELAQELETKQIKQRIANFWNWLIEEATAASLKYPMK